MEGHGRHTAVGRHFGIAVIGMGEGKGLVKGLQGHPELHTISVCDLNGSLAHDIAAQYGVAHSTTALQETLKQPGVDIVVIYTPDQLHLEHIQMAFEAGKHVICTKPLVTSRAEADTVLSLVQHYPQQRLMVGQSSRFFGSMQRQRATFETGNLGDLYFIETAYVHDMRWFYGNRAWARQETFDLLYACCSHPVDLARWYLGDVAEVQALADRSAIGAAAGFPNEDIFSINLRFTSGRTGRVLGFYGLEQAHALRPWIEVALYGSAGSMVAHYPQLEAVIKLKDQPERKELYFEDTYHYFQFEGVNHHAGEFVNYTEHFARSLVNGDVPQPDAINGYKTLATLEAIRQSIRLGTTVAVDYATLAH